MALTKCKECGNEVSTTAKACPKCGAKPPRKMGLLTKVALGFLGLTFVMAFFGFRDRAPVAPATQSGTSAPPSAKASPSVTPAPLAKVPFSDDPDAANFAKNCVAITRNLNTLLQYAAATCQAKGGIVMIRATQEVLSRNQLPGFTAIAVGAAGWAVNEDYYGEGAQFVLINPTKSGRCIMVSGLVAAYTQKQIKDEGADLKSQLLRTIAGAKDVECPPFLT